MSYFENKKAETRSFPVPSSNAFVRRVLSCSWRENILYRYRVSTLSGMASISPLINPLHSTSFYFKYSLKFCYVSLTLYYMIQINNHFKIK